MSDREKIGPRIDTQLWQEFRNDVQERKGQTRGVLGDELENAIREYLRDEDRPIDRRIENRLSRIEQALGVGPTDGGTDTLGASEHTHAPSRLDVAEKPAANAATDKKVAYLAKTIRDEHAGEFNEIPRTVLVETVKDEYGFRSDTAKRYVEQLVDHFDLFDHPVADGVLVTQERREELIEQQKEQTRKNADKELESL